MSWQGALLTRCLRIGRWQCEQAGLRTTQAAMRLSMNKLSRLTRPPARVAVTAESWGGVLCERITTPATARAKGLLLYVHGGGFVAGSPASHRNLAWRLADASGLPVLLVQYRLAPEYPYPAALDDVMAVYRSLLAHGEQAHRIALGGDSAGGNLVLAALLRCRDEGVALPAAVVCFSPWTDLTLSGASLQRNARSEAMVPVRLLPALVDAYVAPGLRRHPEVSPLFAELGGLPPLQVHVADREVLLDDTLRLVRAAEAAGVTAEYRVWPGMPHAFPVLAELLPEGRAAIREAGDFLRGRLRSESAVATSSTADPQGEVGAKPS